MIGEMDNAVWQGIKNIHFIGIGGSGMFPIVQILKAQGYNVTGSDNNPSDTTQMETGMGIPVVIGHDPANLDGADMVVYTAAIMKDNPELMAAQERGIPTFERSVVLGYITSRFDDCICVSGTHGKTTTTAMLTQILVGSGLDPTAVIGGKLPLIGGNGRAGKSSIMTCEACEFVDTFLHLFPDIGVILNVDADHLDYFGTLENIIKSFRKFSQRTTRLLIVNGDDANSLKAVEGLDKKILTFGLGDGNNIQARQVVRDKGLHRFELWQDGKKLTDIALGVPGRHNVLNALAAAAAALQVGATPQQIAMHLADFKGAGRRFEILGHKNGVTIADDYAHHPAELRVTLEVAREMGYNQIWAVFQPFTYSRTAMLLDDFAEVLSIADQVVMSEIMGAREKNTYNIHTKDLADKIKGSVWYPGFEEMARYVMDNAQPGDLVITLGCGDVYKCAKLMLS